MGLSEDKSGGTQCLPFGSKGEVKASPFQQMLSFSTPKHGSLPASDDGSFPPLLVSSSRCCWEDEDLGYGVLLSGDKGFFTPVQWVELQRQALIFRYIDAKAPIPSHLLNSVGDAQNPTIYSGYSVGSLRHIAYGWESLQLGSSSNKDAEPERCRRTDGKKWRCANNAAPNHKYCEKHMNRGRHRSRKPVEGRKGRTKVASSSTPSPAASCGGSNGSPTSSEQQTLTWQPNSAAPLANHLKRTKKDSKCNWMVNTQPGFSDGLSQALATCGIKQETLLDESSPHRESIVSSLDQYDSLPSENMILTSSHHVQNPALLCLVADQQHKPQLANVSIHQAISSDISSSSSSPAEEKESFIAPHDSGPTEMSTKVIENKDLSWASVSSAASYGGPLGEVFNKGYGNDSSNGSSPLNFLTDSWDSDSMARFVSNFASTDDLWFLT